MYVHNRIDIYKNRIVFTDGAHYCYCLSKSFASITQTILAAWIANIVMYNITHMYTDMHKITMKNVI